MSGSSGTSGACSEPAFDSSRALRQEFAAMQDWLNERVAEAQALSWRIAIVRAVHGASSDSWSIEDMATEFDRLHATAVHVRHPGGREKIVSELCLRLKCVGIN